MIFQESDLIFEFSEKEWEVLQYDTHRYYKILSGAGLKGVDFLGIYQKTQVVFFEVKHFRSPIEETTSFQLGAKFNDLIVGKLADSIRAIRVIHQYLGRKWWYRLYQQFASYIPIFLVRNKDWYFWHRLFFIIQRKDQMQFVLWLEGEVVFQKLTTLEHEVLNLVGQFDVVNIKKPVFKKSLIVTQEI